MKLLVVGDIGIIFTYEFVTEIVSKFPGCEVDILSFAPRKQVTAERDAKLRALGCNIFYQPQYKLFKSFKILHAFIRLGELFRYRICKKYDIINIHFPGVDSMLACRYSSKDTRIITSIYGSDVLRANKMTIDVISKLLDKSDAVTVASDYIRERVSEKFGNRFDKKTYIVRYGSVAATFMLDAISKYTKTECKQHFSFPENKITVLCGYNGSRAQRHLEILDELNKLSPSIRSRIFLVLQCSYGFDNNYKRELSETFEKSGFDGVIVTDFMQGETLAKFRKSIDVFLNLQPTDVLSATMIEELEAGAIVVKGEWLCYPDLEKRNIYMRSISEMSELSEEFSYIIDNIDFLKGKVAANQGICEILSWNSQYESWKKIILGQ